MNHEIDLPLNFSKESPEKLLEKWLTECPRIKLAVDVFKKYAHFEKANIFFLGEKPETLGISAPSREKIEGQFLGYTFIKWSPDDKYKPSLKCKFSLEINEEYYEKVTGYEPLPLVFCQFDDDNQIIVEDMSLLGIKRLCENKNGKIRDYIELFKQEFRVSD